MKTQFKKIGIIIGLVLQMSFLYGQYTNADQAIDYINSRLSHSFIQKIDNNGLVTINAPDRMIKFNIKESAFNYNGGNNDDRVRVICEDCIMYYSHGQKDETSNRQSFVSKSKKAAMEAIDAFNFLKKIYVESNDKLKPYDKKIQTSDSAIKYKTVNEVIDMINKNLLHSVITKVDDKGILYINAPENNYKVDLSKAEFNCNMLNDDYRLRIYCDFCIQEYEKNDFNKVINRQSFSADNKTKTYEAIKGLYILKYLYTGRDVSQVLKIRNVSREKINSYTTINDVVDFVNQRLIRSIVQSIDADGTVTINAPDCIYRFNVKEVEFSENHQKSSWFNTGFFGTTSYHPDVLLNVKGRNALKKFEKGELDETLDEQDFECESSYDTKKVVEAFKFIKDKIK